MSIPILLAATATALMAGLLQPPRARLSPLPASRSDVDRDAAGERSLFLRLRPALVVLVVLAGWLGLGGAVGGLIGAAAGAVAWRVLGNSDGPATRRRREQLLRDLPLAVELLGACARSGAAVESALETTADAIGGPVGEAFRGVHRRLALGSDPVEVWRRVQQEPVLAPLGRAVGRSHESGASVIQAFDALAADLREQCRTELLVRAKGVEVKAAAPLGVCFLPAFVLLGIVPLVAGGVRALAILG